MRVFTETSADFIATVTNLTAACLLINSVSTNLTAACLLVQASQATAASLLSQVSQPVAASLLSQVSQATAASLLSQVSQPVAAGLLSQVSNATAACLVVLIGDLGFADTTISNTIAATTLTPSNTRNVITLAQYNISVSNSCATGLV